ncbi:MAG: hypothetical protein GTO02_09200 [Candidatus Dadabacteria bacterium]|nr:hypothetical protein [Candidatus Dadabacteria bacterium]
MNIHKLVEELGYELESIKPTVGTSGVVYFLEEDKVLKITDDENEISVAKKLIGSSPEYLAKIYEIHDMGDCHVIIREKINGLSLKDVENYEEYDKSYYYFAIYEILYLIGRNLFCKKTRKKSEEEIIAKYGNDKASKWASGIVNIANEAKEYGVKYPYDHMYKQNIGIKNGHYACFDLIDKEV